MEYSLRNKRILVTGGAGFIGSHIVDALLAEECQVSVLDDLSTGNLENIASVLPRIAFIQGTITDAQLCLSATQACDVIFHCAAQISVAESVQLPAHCQEVNVQGIFNLLEACRINGVSRFIFSSSAAVYGNHEGVCSETTSCTPTSPYGLSKLIGEQYCQLYSQLYGLKTISLRYFNVYGPRQNPLVPHAGFVARIRHQMKHNQAITLYGDGQQTRDFVPVEDVANAAIKSAQLSDNCMNGKPINIGSGKSISLLEMIDIIREKEFPDYKLPFHFELARSGDIRHSLADCQQLRRFLGLANF